MIDNTNLTEGEFLKNYNPGEYKRPSVTTDNLIFTVCDVENDDYRKLAEKKMQILLIKRKKHPYKDMWALPGGFVDYYEDIDSAVTRELKEETNLEDVYLEQLYTFGDKDRDPRMRVISVAYMTLINKNSVKPKGGDDALEAKWFSITSHLIKTEKKENSIEKIYELLLNTEEEETKSIVIRQLSNIKGNRIEEEIILDKSNGIAFDHGKIIFMGIMRLKNKIEYTDIAFNLMEKYFTLTEIQKVYEVILNKKFTAANFRRKISPFVLETNKTTKGQGRGNRPAKLYKFNTNWKEEKENF